MDQLPETVKLELVVVMPLILRFTNPKVPELVIVPPEIVMVPALGEKVPVTFKLAAVAVLELAEIEPEILRVP